MNDKYDARVGESILYLSIVVYCSLFYQGRVFCDDTIGEACETTEASEDLSRFMKGGCSGNRV